MSDGELLHTLARFPMRIGSHDAWLARPDDVAGVLMTEGFEEYRREVVRCRRDRRALGGVWQGLRRSTGSAVSVIWVNRGDARPAVVFVDVDDEPACELMNRSVAWWDDVDEAVLDCLAGGASMTPADIGRRLGMSEDAATSVITMLAQEGKLRISLVTSAGSDVIERSIRCPVRGTDVTVQLLETHVSASPVRVTWCTAFQPPTAVACDSDCLRSGCFATRGDDSPLDESVDVLMDREACRSAS
ncbi:MAG: AsnC family protein [Candidatus Rokubacteria bacterium]|nr:AsnC family protein [Candidatus Rokubacteria bacterium]